MGVLTEFHRLTPKALKKLRAKPELIGWLLGSNKEVADGAKLGYSEDRTPPSLDIDKAWDEIHILLSGTDQTKARKVLEDALDLDGNGDAEVQTYSPAKVAKGAPILAALSLEELRAEALRRELRTWRGDPIEQLLEYTLGHLESVIRFWNEAAKAGDGIVVSTG